MNISYPNPKDDGGPVPTASAAISTGTLCSIDSYLDVAKYLPSGENSRCLTSA